MGGHLFPNYKTPRLAREIALGLQDALFAKIQSAGLDAYPIPAYRGKEDFGDLDFLSIANPTVSIEQVAQVLEAVEFKVAGGSWSFLCTINSGVYAQVDFLRCPKESEEFFLGYYSYNDFGSLAGRISRTAGLKFSDNGLYYEYRYKDVRNYVLLTKNWQQALGVLDINYAVWQKGFDSVDEIYTLLRSSRYFDKSKFLTDTLNHDKRRRALQRPGWIRFLELVSADHTTPSAPPSFEETRALLYQEFPFLMDQVLELAVFFENAGAVKKRFNGKFVTSLTGLQDKELGEFMSAYRNAWPSPSEFNKAILSFTPERLKSEIMQFYRKYLQDQSLSSQNKPLFKLN
jgi:hypothetical protein